LNLAEIRRKTVPVRSYIESLQEPFKQKFNEGLKTYCPNSGAINQLKASAAKYVIVAFSASWCKDCAVSIPVLAAISEATGLEVRVFGGLKRDLLGKEVKWHIPPSPREVVEFKVGNIPVMIVIDSEGEEIGRIVEKPSLKATLEEEIVQIIASNE
jgi:thiol-disulfide isomerase/thioredoxin